VVDIERAYTQVLTTGALDESPDFAPNGESLIYASRVGRQGVLASVTVDGRFEQRIAAVEGEVREPAWGPLPRR
jgi:TolB protein